MDFIGFSFACDAPNTIVKSLYSWPEQLASSFFFFLSVYTAWIKYSRGIPKCRQKDKTHISVKYWSTMGHYIMDSKIYFVFIFQVSSYYLRFKKRPKNIMVLLGHTIGV